MSQALDRIWKVAKERKKEKLTALFHHISIDLLEEAFYELKENAAPTRLAKTPLSQRQISSCERVRRFLPAIFR